MSESPSTPSPLAVSDNDTSSWDPRTSPETISGPEGGGDDTIPPRANLTFSELTFPPNNTEIHSYEGLISHFSSSPTILAAIQSCFGILLFFPSDRGSQRSPIS